MASMIQSIASSSSNSGSSFSSNFSPNSTSPLDDLTREEKRRLLKSEFDSLASDFLDSVLENVNGNYEAARNCIVLDLKEKDKKQKQKNPSSTNYLEISAEFLTKLANQIGVFEESNNVLTAINQDLESNGSLLLPLDNQIAAMIFGKILDFFGHGTGEEVVQDSESSSEYSSVKSSSVSREVAQQSSNLKEIMEMEQALKASREQYASELAQIAGNVSDDAALSQELVLDKNRCFLMENFPGIPEERLNRLFEQNCFNLTETIKSIEVLYNLKLMVDSEPDSGPFKNPEKVVKRSNSISSYVSSSDSAISSDFATSSDSAISSDCAISSSAFSSSSNSCSDDTASELSEHDQGDLSNFGPIRSEREFKSKVGALISKRRSCQAQIGELLKKCGNRKKQQQHSNPLNQFYRQEMDQLHARMAQFSDAIVACYGAYAHSPMDLHGLNMSEVHRIVPGALRRGQEGLKTRGKKVKRFKMKIITGIGSSIATNGQGTGQIRDWVQGYLARKKVNYAEDGPGAFMVTLSRAGDLDFD